MTTINRQPLTPAERADLRQRCDQADRGWHDDVQIFVSRRVLLALLE